MAISFNSVRALVFAKKSGADFTHSVMLGRQEISITPRDLQRLLGIAGISCSTVQIDRIANAPYADELFQVLGAKTIDAIDASGYEGASIIADMNAVIPDRYWGQFTFVFDGGSLEHIFNFPISVSNLMRITALGGHILSIGPANNFLSHGFYQFSPDLFYRVFSASTGFDVRAMFLLEASLRGRWYLVSDPVAHDQRLLAQRVTQTNFLETFLMTLAVKQASRDLTNLVVQQSDYEYGNWVDASLAKEPRHTSPLKEIIRENIPQSALRALLAGQRVLRRRTGLGRFYRQVDPLDYVQILPRLGPVDRGAGEIDQTDYERPVENQGYDPVGAGAHDERRGQPDRRFERTN